MKLTRLWISNFQCFGEEPTVISLEPMTFLLGPNGAGKTSVLQALTRLFGFERSQRDLRRTDFHTSTTPLDTGKSDTLALWIEAPVARSHTTVVSRWFVMPMAAIVDAAIPASAACSAEVTDAQMSAGSCSTQPGCG